MLKSKKRPSSALSSSLPVPTQTLEERRNDLERFQWGFLNGDRTKIELFEDLYKKCIFDHRDPHYQAWLPLKFAAAGRKDEAFNIILKSQLSEVLPKSKKKSIPTVQTITTLSVIPGFQCIKRLKQRRRL